jgi:hypothetical protein
MAGPSKEVFNPKIEIASLGTTSIFSQITAAPSLSGTELTITVANSNGFRVNDVLADDNLVQGRVKAVVGNTIVLTPLNTALSSSTHFQAGKTAKVFFDASANFDSRAKGTVKHIPDLDYTYCAVKRESGTQKRRERTGSYVTWHGNYWHASWMDIVLANYAKQCEFQSVFSELGAFNVGGADEYYTTMGLHQSIKQRGTYFPISSALTLSDFNDFLAEIARKNANSGRNLGLLVGVDGLATLQTLIGNQYLTYTGTANTFGGVSVQGIDIYKYTYLGLSVDIARWSLLDDPMFANELSTINGKPKRSSSMYCLDMTPFPAADGSGMMNPVQNYHFTGSELIAGFTPGMIGVNDMTPSQLKDTIAQYQASLTVSDLDSVQFNILSDTAKYFAGDKCGLIELTS